MYLELILAITVGLATPFPQSPTRERIDNLLLVRGPHCKDYSSCREAVVAWCAGTHPGADRDHDGIPCENVCSTRAQVVKIEAGIGCSK